MPWMERKVTTNGNFQITGFVHIRYDDWSFAQKTRCRITRAEKRIFSALVCDRGNWKRIFISFLFAFYLADLRLLTWKEQSNFEQIFVSCFVSLVVSLYVLSWNLITLFCLPCGRWCYILTSAQSQMILWLYVAQIAEWCLLILTSFCCLSC